MEKSACVVTGFFAWRESTCFFKLSAFEWLTAVTCLTYLISHAPRSITVLFSSHLARPRWDLRPNGHLWYCSDMQHAQETTLASRRGRACVSVRNWVLFADCSLGQHFVEVLESCLLKKVKPTEEPGSNWYFRTLANWKLKSQLAGSDANHTYSADRFPTNALNRSSGSSISSGSKSSLLGAVPNWGYSNALYHKGKPLQPMPKHPKSGSPNPPENFLTV